METLFQALDELDDLVEVVWRRWLLSAKTSSETMPEYQTPYATTRLRPACFASYKRTSARFNSRSAEASVR
jgi:hypothetical protein